MQSVFTSVRRRPGFAALAAVLAALIAGSASPASAATTFNVNPVTGKDRDPGTATKPFRTIATALTKAQAGDTVKLAGGIYAQDTNGERYSTTSGSQTVTVPAGVSVKGTPATPAAPFGSLLRGAPNQIAPSSRAARRPATSASRASAERSMRAAGRRRCRSSASEEGAYA